MASYVYDFRLVVAHRILCVCELHGSDQLWITFLSSYIKPFYAIVSFHFSGGIEMERWREKG